MTHRQHQSLSGKTRAFSFVLCLGMLAGVLIWAKLRLVTDIPRSAYADPREVEIPGDEPGDELIDQTPGLLEGLSEPSEPSDSSDVDESNEEQEADLETRSITDPDLYLIIKP